MHGSEQVAQTAAAQLAQQFLRVDAELAEKSSVLVGIDLVGQLACGLVGLLVLALVLQQLQNLVLADVHRSLSSAPQLRGSVASVQDCDERRPSTGECSSPTLC